MNAVRPSTAPATPEIGASFSSSDLRWATPPSAISHLDEPHHEEDRAGEKDPDGHRIQIHSDLSIESRRVRVADVQPFPVAKALGMSASLSLLAESPDERMRAWPV